MADIDNKLTHIINNPLANKGFHLRHRFPGWLPDEIRSVDNAGTTLSMEAIFVQEVLQASITSRNKIERTPFQPDVNNAKGNDISWILGSPLKPDGNRKKKPRKGEKLSFDSWLAGLTRLIRNYNASLYRLRKLHLDAEDNTLKMDPLPSDHHDWSPRDAEKDYEKTVAALRKYLCSGFATSDSKKVIVDMIQVNGYIVSLRAVAGIIPGTKDLKPFQPGGSSSSQVLVDDPFSSSSP